MTSRKTKYFNLPIYAANDRIDPIADLNGAMEKIDDALHMATDNSDSAMDISAEAITKVNSLSDMVTALQTATASNTAAVNGLKEFESNVEDSLHKVSDNPINIYEYADGQERVKSFDMTQAIIQGKISLFDILVVTVADVDSNGDFTYEYVPMYAFLNDGYYRWYSISSGVLIINEYFFNGTNIFLQSIDVIKQLKF